MALKTLEKKPELISGIHWPTTMVFGGSGFDGAAANLKPAFPNLGQPPQPVGTTAQR